MTITGQEAACTTWQYQQYFERAERLVFAVEKVAGIEWPLPLPVLSRMLTPVMDGLILGWLIDRDDEVAEQCLTRFADCFTAPPSLDPPSSHTWRTTRPSDRTATALTPTMPTP